MYKNLLLLFFLVPLTMINASLSDWFVGAGAAASFGASIYFKKQYNDAKQEMRQHPDMMKNKEEKYQQDLDENKRYLESYQRKFKSLQSAEKFRRTDSFEARRQMRQNKIMLPMQELQEVIPQLQEKINKSALNKYMYADKKDNIKRSKLFFNICSISAFTFTSIGIWKYFSK